MKNAVIFMLSIGLSIVVGIVVGTNKAEDRLVEYDKKYEKIEKDVSTFDLDLTNTTRTSLAPGIKSTSNSSNVDTEEYQNGYLNVNQKTLRIDTARVNSSKDMNMKEKEHAVHVEVSTESRTNCKDSVLYGINHPLLPSSSSEEGSILHSQ